MNRIITLSLLLAITLLLLCGNKGTRTLESTGNDFTLTSLDGDEYTLSKLKGNVVIVDFWATWCPPCRREIPHFVELYNRYKDKGLIILGISSEEKATLEAFRDENKITYPLLLGSTEIFKRFGVSSIPHTLFIDKKGKVRKIQIGFADEFLPVFEALIDTLLAE